jgi:hypothetical protein
MARKQFRRTGTSEAEKAYSRKYKHTKDTPLEQISSIRHNDSFQEQITTIHKAQVESGFLSVLDDRPLVMNCKTCSLVSSSGQILGKKRGKEIDKADCVFRMNGAPVQGFEIDVGGKTTVRVVCFNSVQIAISTLEQHMDSLPKFLIAWGGIQLSNHDTSSYRGLVNAAKKYPHMKVYRSLKEHDLYQDKLFQEETGQGRRDSGAWLSTGWFSIALMVKFCQSISIYGMVPPDHCRYNEIHRRTTLHSNRVFL